jgi:exosome complex component RRP4
MSSEIKVENKAVVIPGQILANGMDYLPGEDTYRDGESIRSNVLGLANVSGRVMKVTALSGPYIPKVGDTIIGKVSDILMSGWRVQTGTPYSAMLNVRDATQRFVRKGEDLSKILEIGDSIVAKITNVTSQNLIDLTMKEPGLFQVRNGRVISVGPQKVPRIIGKSASMIQLIKRYTGCKIVVGQNGSVLIDGKAKSEEVAAQAIRMIEKFSHHSGLTAKVEDFLKSIVKEMPELKDTNSQAFQRAINGSSSMRRAGDDSRNRSRNSVPGYTPRPDSKSSYKNKEQGSENNLEKSSESTENISLENKVEKPTDDK